MIIGIIIALLAIFLFYTFGQQLISLYLNDNPTDSLKTLNYGMDYLKIMLFMRQKVIFMSTICFWRLL